MFKHYYFNEVEMFKHYCLNNSESVYIHIPFCLGKKCDYCDFFSVSDAKSSLQEKILAETLNQLSFFYQKYCQKKIKTIYIGGGTPSAIGWKELEYFLESLSSICSSTGGKRSIEEFTIEINPENCNKNLLSVLKNSPVTRISIGIQSFSDKMLSVLGRNSTSKKNYSALEAIKKLDKKISLDLISSIPGQTVKEAEKEVITALTFNPEHLSIYNLTLEEGTLLAKKYSEDDQNDNCWLSACSTATLAGYNHYEISNFALPGNKSIHNYTYWEMKSYIGCGPGAVSTVYPKKENIALRITSPSSFEQFLKGEKDQWGCTYEKVTGRDLFTEIIMMGLRTEKGVSSKKIEKLFRINLFDSFALVIEKWEKDKLLNKDAMEKGQLSLTEKGRLFHTSCILDIMKQADFINFYCFPD